MLEAPGHLSSELRRAAAKGGGAGLSREAEALVARVGSESYRVTDADIDALRVAGHSDDEIFELTVSAAVGAAGARLERGLAAGLYGNRPYTQKALKERGVVQPRLRRHALASHQAGGARVYAAHRDERVVGRREGRPRDHAWGVSKGMPRHPIQVVCRVRARDRSTASPFTLVRENAEDEP